MVNKIINILPLKNFSLKFVSKDKIKYNLKFF